MNDLIETVNYLLNHKHLSSFTVVFNNVLNYHHKFIILTRKILNISRDPCPMFVINLKINTRFSGLPTKTPTHIRINHVEYMEAWTFL